MRESSPLLSNAKKKKLKEVKGQVDLLVELKIKKEKSNPRYKLFKAIPKLPKSKYGPICFVLNIFLPGIGTLYAAALDKNNKISRKHVNIVMGVLQLLTAIVVLGWLWSIVWGYIIYKRNKGIARYL